ncbi:hypothetical protein [Acinetobacter sp.]|uniref:hypothetical protein n=1 Tax=Acinetobacter sp. TaxID=472 RepID=UPI000C0953EC|nr:hypothetical protein [Acinetobacter sp.]MAK31994.1 hypothetical protein [Acinetobacter sp.]
MDREGYYTAPSPELSKENPKEVKQEMKTERKESKWDYKISKTQEKTELVTAKASRLKWLTILIGLVMAGFGAFKAGLFGG